jgi:hypothetical protein
MNMKLPTSFFLCLIGTLLLSLSACAQPMPTEQEKPSDQKLVVVKPEPMANEPSSPQKNSSNKDMTSMIDLDNPPRGPAIPAVELKKQILALIASLQSREDMRREHVEKVMGISLKPHPRADDMFIYFGQVTEGWQYNIASTYTYGDPIPSLEIGFISEEKVSNDALPNVCTLAFEPLAKELVALGYERGPRPLQREWGFGKDNLTHKAGFGIGVKVYSADNGTEDGIQCVESINIGSGVLHE